MTDTEYEPVIPFVAVTSQGGKYDDDAFAAGWEAGAITVNLAVGVQIGAESLSFMTKVGIANQLDLVAMYYGYRMTTEPTGEQTPQWQIATFTRVGIQGVGEAKHVREGD